MDDYKKQLFEANSIRRDDYQRLKRLMIEGLPEQTYNVQIGDSFTLILEKHTYFSN
jgi:hypothetical protein